MNVLRYIAILILACLPLLAAALTRYSAAYNGFAGTSLGRFCVDGNGLVEIANEADTTALVPDTALISQRHYRYMARMSNSHNRVGRSYRYYTADGGRHSRSDTWVGIAVNMTDGDTTMVMLGEEDTAPYDDIRGERRGIVKVIRHRGCLGVDTLATWTLMEGLDLRGGFNAIAADVNDSVLTVMVGDRRLRVVGSVCIGSRHRAARVAVAVGSAAMARLERTVLFTGDDVVIERDTGMDATSLERYFAGSLDALEGFYTYLDRDMNERHARLGGKYTVALIRSDDGYIIIYVDGAQICPGEWYMGRVKGYLKRTSFTANFNLTWIDALGAPAPEESFATIEGGSILSLHFPLLNSVIRLHKTSVAP